MPRLVKIVLAVIVGIPLLGIAAAYVAGSLQRTRNAGDEASAIGALRSIVSGQAVFAASACGGRYAPTLTMLGAGLPGSTVGFVSPDLATGDVVVKSGYRITMVVPADAGPPGEELNPACKGTVTGFTATAVPLDAGQTGKRFFIVDEEGDVKQATSASFADAVPVR